MKKLCILSVIMAVIIMMGGCVTGPIPKEDIQIPIDNGGFLLYPAGGFTGEVYFTLEEMADPEKFKKKYKIIEKFFKDLEQKNKKGGCLPGEICG